MMYFTVIFIFALASSAVSEDYTTKYDNIDLDAIIQNDRLLKNYVDCLLEKGKCTNEGAELKKHISEALETGCAKCTERQRGGVRRVIVYLSENKKDWWNELVQKYDPDGVYRKKYSDLIKKEEIAV